MTTPGLPKTPRTPPSSATAGPARKVPNPSAPVRLAAKNAREEQQPQTYKSQHVGCRAGIQNYFAEDVDQLLRAIAEIKSIGLNEWASVDAVYEFCTKENSLLISDSWNLKKSLEN